MKNLDLIAVVLLIVGGLNWGLVAVARFDLVATLAGLEFGQTNGLTRIVYGLVGLSAVYVAVQLRAMTRRWATNSSAASHALAR
jgi:uncharacterized membrane protein YuzA (DUF378 family)